ncbi:hypothetical protein TNCT_489091 [Trichonephila clavata]|uniref:Uncharacterized protein n=1 Tax=Trichonephila clavata TaxID=2740835 RepID=A0A8X6L072_TRICU|nr:hypothetical protein TNCT_489091 [Trichonephila clavata]
MPRVVLRRSWCYDKPTAESRRRVVGPFVPPTQNFPVARRGLGRAFRIHRLASCANGVRVATTPLPVEWSGGSVDRLFRRRASFPCYDYRHGVEVWRGDCHP